MTDQNQLTCTMPSDREDPVAGARRAANTMGIIVLPLEVLQ